MKAATLFILNNYQSLEVLQKSPRGTTELVLGKDRRLYVRKIFTDYGLPVEEIKKLAIPGLAKIYFLTADEEKIYLIQEYIEGDNLTAYVENQGPLSEKTIWQLAWHLSKVLEELHRASLLHRDLKPSNIMVDGQGKVHVVDIETLRLASSAKPRDTVVVGTEGYAPPEQFGFTTTDMRSDIYAYGKTIKELYQGRRPSLLMERLLNKCTRFDPQDRYNNIEQVQQALRRAQFMLQGWVKYLAAALGCVLLGLGFYYQQPPKEEQPQNTTVQNKVVAVQEPVNKAVSTKTAPKEQGLNKIEEPKTTEAGRPSEAGKTLEEQEPSGAQPQVGSSTIVASAPAASYAPTTPSVPAASPTPASSGANTQEAYNPYLDPTINYKLNPSRIKEKNHDPQNDYLAYTVPFIWRGENLEPYQNIFPYPDGMCFPNFSVRNLLPAADSCRVHIRMEGVEFKPRVSLSNLEQHAVHGRLTLGAPNERGHYTDYIVEYDAIPSRKSRITGTNFNGFNFFFVSQPIKFSVTYKWGTGEAHYYESPAMKLYHIEK